MFNDERNNQELLKLFEIFLTHPKIKKMKMEALSKTLFFELTTMTQNNVSKIFNESACVLSLALAEPLFEKGYIQKINAIEPAKYSLTLRGLTIAIKEKYGKTFEDQFNDFINSANEKYNFTEPGPLKNDEKTFTLSLILMACTSETTSISLDNDENQENLKNVFDAVLKLLKAFQLSDANSDWKKNVCRKESESYALVSRLTDLPRKTNHYYNVHQKTTGYFNLENNGAVDKDGVFYLLGKIFEFYNPICDYADLYKKILEINQTYYIKFTGRTINPLFVIDLFNTIHEFLNLRILKLPQKISDR